MDKEDTYIMKYYSAIKESEIMLLAATRMDLEIFILSQSEKDKYDITYMWNPKYGTNEPIYKTEIDSQIQKSHL